MQMSNNGTQVIVVNGVFGYVYSVAAGFQQITDPNFNPARTVTFFDGYFVFDHVDSNQFFLSALLDGLTYPPLDFASAEVLPDFVVGVLNQQENLLIFGGKSVETWYDAGTVDFPFARYDGATIERGCIAPLTILKEDNSVFFLGDDGIFYRLNGVTPVRISTHAIEYAWQQYVTMADASAFSYTEAGHKFIVINFLTANKTWVYDIATNLWHERESFDIHARSLGRWRGNCAVQVYDKILIGDAFSGQIGFVDPKVYTEFGNPMIAMMVGPMIHNERTRVLMSLFELDMEVGVGLNAGQGDDPQVMIDFSDDGGRTFDSLQQWASMGKIGQYGVRLRWFQLGSFFQRCVRVVISDPVVRTVISNRADIKVGMK